ncbi:MAG: glycosyltransferase family 2 protein [Blautia sp.]|nr:glycosyltransferase family 2 protein [Blautia sp.]
MNEDDVLYIIIPAYNEEANIAQVISDWYPVVATHNGQGASRLVVLDDGSKDHTLSIIKESALDRPLLIPLTWENHGHGATVRHGYEFALSQGAQYIFQTDGDGQTLPDEFEAFWDKRKDFDMVIGWRKGRGDGFGRVVTTKVLRAVLLLTFHVWVKDANTPFRLMQAEAVARDLPLIPKDYFLSNVLLSVIFTKKHRRIRYLPITFRPRQGGVNSINMKRIIDIGKNAYKDFRQLNRTINAALKQ